MAGQVAQAIVNHPCEMSSDGSTGGPLESQRRTQAEIKTWTHDRMGGLGAARAVAGLSGRRDELKSEQVGQVAGDCAGQSALQSKREELQKEGDQWGLSTKGPGG